MAIIGVGVDLVHLSRISAICRRRGSIRLAARILSTEETVHWNVRWKNASLLGSKTRFLAVRWAVKEAAYKALYPVIQPTWKDLTYSNVDRKPSLTYNPSIPTDPSSTRIGKIHVSVSHDGDYVLAYVVVEDVSPE